MKTEVQSETRSYNLVTSTCILVGILCALPFSFGGGIASLGYLLSAVCIGLIWSLLLVAYWKTKNSVFSGVAFVFVILGHKFAEGYLTTDSPFGHFFQWLFIVFIILVIVSYFYERAKLPSCDQN